MYCWLLRARPVFSVPLSLTCLPLSLLPGGVGGVLWAVSLLLPHCRDSQSHSHLLCCRRRANFMGTRVGGLLLFHSLSSIKAVTTVVPCCMAVTNVTSLSVALSATAQWQPKATHPLKSPVSQKCHGCLNPTHLCPSQGTQRWKDCELPPLWSLILSLLGVPVSEGT